MLFKKADLQNLAFDDFDPKEFEVISNELVDTTRWSLQYDMIFKYKEKFYSTYYARGATEMQDECPYEYQGDEIDCIEVEPYTETVTLYRKVT